jgi:hypothetical protein
MNTNAWNRAYKRAWSLKMSPTRIAAVLIVLVVPGGLVLPLCYAAVAVLHRGARKPARANAEAAPPERSPISFSRFFFVRERSQRQQIVELR